MQKIRLELFALSLESEKLATKDLQKKALIKKQIEGIELKRETSPKGSGRGVLRVGKIGGRSGG
jgi:hypothetical protein